MKAISSILAAAVFCTATTTLAASPGITKTLIQQERAVIQGKADASHELVLRIDDGSSKPREWRSSANGDFRYVVEVTDRVPLGGGKMGTGLVATYTHGNVTATFNIAVGKCILRPKSSSVSNDGIFTFADVQRDDGRGSPVSFRIERAVKR